MRETRQIKYSRGYKYQLRETAFFVTKIRPAVDIHTDLVSLYRSGLLEVRKYFAWDGCSGPTWDDSTNIRGSLAHDALYYLIRMGLLHPKWRIPADAELRRIMLADGAWRFRADYYEWAVNEFAEGAARPEAAKKILVAPETVYFQPGMA